MARQDQVVAIRGGRLHIDHLHSGKFLQHRPCGTSRCQRAGGLFERNLQIVRDEGDKDTGLEPEPELKLLLERLRLELPAQPPPKITTTQVETTPLV